MVKRSLLGVSALAISMIHILNTNNIYLKYPWATERLPITISIAHASFPSEECELQKTPKVARDSKPLCFFRQAIRTYGSYDKWRASHGTKQPK